MESGLTEYFDFLKEGLAQTAQTGPFAPSRLTAMACVLL